MNNLCAICDWIVTEEQIKGIGGLLQLAHQLGCSFHLNDPQLTTKSEGYKILRFIVYSSAISDLQEFIDKAKDQASFAEWRFSDCEIGTYEQTGLEDIPPLMFNSLLDSLLRSALQNSLFGEEHDGFGAFA